jgi:hypothetical protein
LTKTVESKPEEFNDIIIRSEGRKIVFQWCYYAEQKVTAQMSHQGFRLLESGNCTSSMPNYLDISQRLMPNWKLKKDLPKDIKSGAAIDLTVACEN